MYFPAVSEPFVKLEPALSVLVYKFITDNICIYETPDTLEGVQLERRWLNGLEGVQLEWRWLNGLEGFQSTGVREGPAEEMSSSTVPYIYILLFLCIFELTKYWIQFFGFFQIFGLINNILHNKY